MTPGQFVQHLEAVRKATAGEVRGALVEVGARGLRLLKEGYLSGGRLRVRSGRLRGSVSTRLAAGFGAQVLTLSAGSSTRADLRYAGIQEEGGTIKPRRGKFLAIPLGPAKTGAGVPRFASPRDVPGLRYQPIRGGLQALLVKDGGGRAARAVPWFLLVRSVRITGKHYMRDAGAAVTSAFPVVLAERIAKRIGR